jgi:CPA1 family monovalent cation:H+ antiporter
LNILVMAIDFYGVFTLLMVLTAGSSYINFRYLKLPPTIGIMIIALICSVGLVFAGKISISFKSIPQSIITSVDFESLLMRVMLSFLLFAGGVHIDIQKLKKQMAAILTFATVGVIISTCVVSVLMYLTFTVFGLHVAFIYCLLFGALISPTDPIAVLGILKKANIPSNLEIKISGESLFNDGVGVVIFATIVELARLGTDSISIGQISWTFLREAGGGIIWGLLLGYACFYLLRSIDSYQVEVMLTLAIVTGGYLLATYFHISGALAMVVAGIITGNKGKEEAMSDVTRDYVGKFWELIDDILNGILFLLIGLEALVISFHSKIVYIGLITVVIVLLARFVSVLLPTLFLQLRRPFERNTIPILTWGGLRGGISVALALSLPYSMHRNEFVPITYIVVVFSIIVQGLTIGRLAKKLGAKKS